MENKDVEKNDVQEEKEERKDGGMFFGILGVATLLITIVGATYAYFTATASNNNVIQGNAAVTGIDLVVEKISNEPDAGLIPMLDSDIQKGVTGTDSNICVDSNGNAVCQLYKVTVTNRSEAAVSLNSTLTIKPVSSEGDGDSIFTNLKWAEITSNTDATLIGNANLITITDWKQDFLLEGSAVKDLYLLLWISETTSNQSDVDKGSYVGTITFNSAAGAGVTAVFSDGV